MMTNVSCEDFKAFASEFETLARKYGFEPMLDSVQMTIDKDGFVKIAFQDIKDRVIMPYQEPEPQESWHEHCEKISKLCREILGKE